MSNIVRKLVHMTRTRIKWSLEHASRNDYALVSVYENSFTPNCMTALTLTSMLNLQWTQQGNTQCEWLHRHSSSQHSTEEKMQCWEEVLSVDRCTKLAKIIICMVCYKCKCNYTSKYHSQLKDIKGTQKKRKKGGRLPMTYHSYTTLYQSAGYRPF